MDISKSEKEIFYFEELKDVKELKSLKKEAFKKANTLLQEILNNSNKRNLIQLWDEAYDELVKIHCLAYFFMNKTPAKEIAQSAKKIFSSTSQALGGLYQNKKLYDILKSETNRKQTINDTSIINNILFHFQTSGILLDNQTRKKINQLNFQINKNETNYVKNRDKKWWQKVISCQYFSSEEKLLYNLFLKRLELANLYGYPNYADFTLKRSVAGTTSFVQAFLRQLKIELKAKTFKELSEFIQAAGYDCHASELTFFQICLMTKCFENFLMTKSHLKNYFSVDTCLDGLKLIFKSLFDVRFEGVQDKDVKRGKLWPNDMKKYCIKEANEIIGYIYCDFLGKHHKYISGHCTMIQGARICDDGTYQKPIVVVTLNKPCLDSHEPRLLDLLEVDNLFHEMGHAMLYILGSTNYLCVGPINSPTDLAEVPSKFMEQFATNFKVVSQFAKHYETREVMPPHMIIELMKYNKFQKLLAVLRRVIVSEFDQACHSLRFLDYSISDLACEIFDLPTQVIDLSCLVEDFSASFYKYLLGEAIASSIWHKYFINDPLNLKAGKKLRKEFLVQTGLQPPRDLVDNYLQMKITPKFLAHSILKNF